MTVIKTVPIPDSDLKGIINAQDYKRRRWFKYEAVRTKAAGDYICRRYSPLGKVMLALMLLINIIYYAFKGLIKYAVEACQDSISEFKYVGKYTSNKVGYLLEE